MPVWSARAVMGLVVAAALQPAASNAQVFADFQTSLGDFTVELFHADVPRTVANFVRLAEGTQSWIDPRTQELRVGVPYYDGIIFHRVIPNFMIQAGSPRGDGTDGPGYKIPDEFSKLPTGQLRHTHNAAGRLSMANSGAHTNGSQFFITTSVTPPIGHPVHLNDKHTVFGQVAAGPAGTAAEGQSVVNAISAVPRTPGNTQPADKPLTDVVIESVRIRKEGEAVSYDPQAWVLPDVTQPRLVTSVTTVPVTGETAIASMELEYDRALYEATAFQVATDMETWRVLRLSGATATPIAAASEPSALNITALQTLPDYFVRARRIDYAGMIAHTKPPLTAAAEIRVQVATPSPQVFTLRRTSETSGSWQVDGASGATGTFTGLTYDFGSGDAGFFSPRLIMNFPDTRLPWPGGVTLSALQLTLTFDAQSTTTGYFTAAGFVSVTSPTATGKGVFTVIAP